MLDSPEYSTYLLGLTVGSLSDVTSEMLTSEEQPFHFSSGHEGGFLRFPGHEGRDLQAYPYSTFKRFEAITLSANERYGPYENQTNFPIEGYHPFMSMSGDSND